MSIMDKVIDLVRSASALLRDYAELTGQLFSEVLLEYDILLRPWTDVEGMIKYYESLTRLHGDLATFYSGPPVFEGKGNQTKALDNKYIQSSAVSLMCDTANMMLQLLFPHSVLL